MDRRRYGQNGDLNEYFTMKGLNMEFGKSGQLAGTDCHLSGTAVLKPSWVA